MLYIYQEDEHLKKVNNYIYKPSKKEKLYVIYSPCISSDFML